MFLQNLMEEGKNIVWIKNIISYTDRWNIGGLQVDDISYQQKLRQKVPTNKLYQWGKSSFK